MTVKEKIFQLLMVPCLHFFDCKKADHLLSQTEEVQVEVSGRPLSELKGNIFVCTAKGLFLVSSEGVRQMCSGHFFGLTKEGDRYYLFQDLNYAGRILTFQFQNNQVVDLKVFVKRTVRNIHQIAFFDSHLFASDPSRNQIIVYNREAALVNRLYPLGRLSAGKQSENYAHLNSVYPYQDRIYVVAHNYTQKSGRKSEILILDRKSFELVGRLKDVGKSAHNVILQNGKMLICDSLSGRVCDGQKEIIKMDRFTRGLALNDEALVIGGSMYGDRGERIGKDCFLYFLDREFRLVRTICFKEIGPCFEVRFTGLDYGYGV